MANFKVHIVGISTPYMMEADAQTAVELCDQLARSRFLTARLIEENGYAIEPPVGVLVPIQRIQMVAETA